MSASSALLGSTSGSPCSVTTTGSRLPSSPAACSSCSTDGLVGGEPVVVQSVAGQEVADLPGSRRPAVTDHLGVRDGTLRRSLPGLQQLVDDGVQLLGGRIPRLEQVMVQVDDVDGVDGGMGVGVCGQQHPFGRRVEVHRRLEEVDTGHLGHPVVGDEHRDRLTSQLELLEGVQRVRTRFGPHDPVGIAVFAPQIPGNGPGHPGIVVDGQHHRFAGCGIGTRGVSHRRQVCLCQGCCGRAEARPGSSAGDERPRPGKSRCPRGVDHVNP